MEEDLERDMTPRLIGDLGLRYPTKKGSKKARYGLYECQYCGTQWECRTTIIKKGISKSCGCQKINTLGITHGLKSNRFYNTWKLMIQRCTNLKSKVYNYYGGRGITVCEEWLDVATFVAWAELTHPNSKGVSLDRIDNDGNYEPSNCRWVTKSEQVINQRMKITNTSGYKGVIWNKKNSNWVAVIGIATKKVYIGSFKIKEEAVLARDNYIIENNLLHKLSTDYKREES